MSREIEKKPRKGMKVFGITVLVLVLILALIIGGTFLFVNGKLGKMQQIDLDTSDLDVSDQAQTQLSNYRNIALFAVDSRDNSLDRGNRSDGIIIASINNTTKEVRLVSVYRDTYVDIEGQGLDKITHAYSYGSASLAVKTLNKNLDLNITEFATVNFDAVAEAVDMLGGVEINIESRDELNYLNANLNETARVTGKTAKRLESTGRQTLDGVQAVAYARIRYTEGGDYKRAERMRIVLEAMLSELKTKNISEINRFTDVVLEKVYTNLKASDIFAMMPSMANYKITKSIGWPYDVRGITLDRWYGVPVTLEQNVTKLHQELFDNQDYTPTEEVKNISNQIITRTGYGK